MRTKGFTLIEILVSVGILATISIVVAQSLFTVVRSNAKTEILKDVKQSGEQAMLTMTRMIQNAQEITSFCSEAGESDPFLTIVNPDGGTTIFTCVLDGTVTRIASVSAATEYLTDNHVTIGGDLCATSSLAFACTTAAGQPSHVSISFSLTQVGTPAQQFEQASESFQGSAVVRNVRQ